MELRKNGTVEQVSRLQPSLLHYRLADHSDTEDPDPGSVGNDGDGIYCSCSRVVLQYVCYSCWSV